MITIIITNIAIFIIFYNSHKKRKDSLETRSERAVFSLLEFQKLLEPSPRNLHKI